MSTGRATSARPEAAAAASRETEDLELDEAALWDDDESRSADSGLDRAASAESADSRGGPEPGAAVAEESSRGHEASDSSTDEDIDAALEGISLERSSSISKAMGRGPGLPAASPQLPGAADSAAAPMAAAGPGGADSRNFRFQPLAGVAASMPISAGGLGRQMRTTSDLSQMLKQGGITTESKLGTSVPVAIPSAARRKLVQHGVLTGAEDGIRASSFVPPHQLMAQMENNGDKFSLEISKGGISPSASLKRDRLVQRNAILRRTGFIEGGRGASFLETMDPIREGVIEPGPSVPVPLSSSIGLSSALSAALSSSLPRSDDKR